MSTVICLFLCFILGFLSYHLYTLFFLKTIGTLKIDTSDDKKDIYLLQIEIPMDELPKHKAGIIKIESNSSASQTAPNMND